MKNVLIATKNTCKNPVDNNFIFDFMMNKKGDLRPLLIFQISKSIPLNNVNMRSFA